MELITTHKNADFDAVASVFAAKILYPAAKPFLPTTINRNVRNFLSIHKDHFKIYSSNQFDNGDISRLIIVDVNKWSRLEGLDQIEEMDNVEIHLWDHHGLDGEIKASWSCQKAVGSTSTLLVGSIQEKGIDLSPIQATLFLAGIYEDTGNLTFPSTTSEDAIAVGYLLDQNADINIVKTFLRPAYGPNQKEVLFEMLKNGTRIKVNGYEVGINSIQIEGHTPGLSVVLDMYQEIMNLDAAFGIFSDMKRGKSILIGRGSGEGINIGDVMKNFGGGGHPTAGSALLKSENPSDIEEWLSDLLNNNNRSSIQISDLMSFPVFTISQEATIRDAAILLREKGCTGIPVVEDEKLVGIISRRDISKVRNSSGMDSPVKAIMSRNVKSIEPGYSIRQASRIMVKYDVGRLPVLENGKLIGIITRSDTMRYYYDLVENADRAHFP